MVVLQGDEATYRRKFRTVRESSFLYYVAMHRLSMGTAKNDKKPVDVWKGSMRFKTSQLTKYG